jgi:elongation factor 1-alpha
MIKGSGSADIGLLLLPADGGFTTALAKGNRKEGIISGQTREHARLLNLLGIKQLIVGINKMDENTAKYSQERYDEIKSEVQNMLAQVGWNKTLIKDGIPIIPISGWVGDNLVKQSTNMPWWKGVDVKSITGETVHVHTLYDALDKFVQIPKRPTDVPLRIPVSGVYKIKGVGDVITGRVEQGTALPGTEVKFLPSSLISNSIGKIFSVEMHHTSVPSAGPGDNVGLCIKGLTKETMPQVGDIIVLNKDDTLPKVTKFTAQVQVLEHPGELKVGYTPICYVRTGRAPSKICKINWKMGKETGGQKVNDPVFIKSGEMAEVVFEPQMPIAVDTFARCEGLSRCCFMDGNAAVLLGKIIQIE